MTNPEPLSERICRVATVREIERAALSQHAPGELMQRAGALATEHIVRLAPLTMQRRLIVILAGPGNNGGDGFVIADQLAQLGYRVHLVRERAVDIAHRSTDISQPDAPDCARSYRVMLAQQRRWPNLAISDQLPSGPLAAGDVIVDAMFGIGLSRPLEPPYSDWTNWANRQPSIRVAIDNPSGLNADTGVAHAVAFQADLCISFICAKPGPYTGAGPNYARQVVIETLGVDVDALAPAQLDPSADAHRKSTASGALFGQLRAEQNAARLRRWADAHKGEHGTAVIIGGAAGMRGAALMAGRAALLSGAGRVRIGFPGRDPSADGQYPELMCSTTATALTATGPGCALACGPGLGRDKVAQALLRAVVQFDQPLLLDADALNLLARSPRIQQQIKLRQAPTVITPHPLEAARLLGKTVAEVQADRIACALTLAERLNAVVALKGAGTVVADRDGWTINQSGTPALATGGSGDSLTGIITALLAQGVEAGPATRLGVWLHGSAAERVEQAHGGPIGARPTEVNEMARIVLNELVAASDRQPRINRRLGDRRARSSDARSGAPRLRRA